MKLELNQLSLRYSAKKLSEVDIPDILEVCKGNPIYYKYYKTDPTSENIRESLGALPPNKTMEDKYFLGFYDGDKLVAILDLITRYPNEETAYIGWFIMNQAFQGEGIGTQIITDVTTYLKEKHFKHVKLGYIKENKQAEHFWLKNHFSATGSETQEEHYTVVVMQRNL